MKREVGPIQCVSLSGALIEVDPADDLGIDVNTLTEEMTKQPGLYAWYNTLKESASHKADQYRKSLKRERERLYRGVKAKEKWKADSEINANKEVLRLEKLEDMWQHRANLLSGIVESFRQRKDMLQSIGKRERDDREGESEVHTMASRFKHRSKGE